jgi:hypothetical protein
MQSWNALCESFMKGRSGKYGSVENDIRFGFVFSENSETKVLCHNLECDDIADEAQSLLHAVSQELPSLAYIRETPLLLAADPTSSSSWSEQLFAWNCLPNINISGRKKNSKDRVFVLWQTTALRSQVEDSLNYEAITISEAVQLIEGWSPYTPSKTPRSRNARRPTPLSSTAEYLDPFSDVNSDVHKFSSGLNSSIFSDFRQSLMRDGIFRILRNDADCLQVVWNSYDSKSGAFLRRKYVTTSMRLPAVHQPVLLCEGCPSFQHSSQIMEASASFCLHTKLLAVLKPQLNPDNFLSSKDPFVRWALRCSTSGANVVKLDEDCGFMKFFVNVSDGIARNEGTSVTSLCYVWLSTNGNRLSCESSVCVNKTMKGVKETTSVSDVCCHLRAVFEHAEHKDLWQMGVYASSYSVCGSKELMQAFDVDEGEFSVLGP